MHRRTPRHLLPIALLCASPVIALQQTVGDLLSGAPADGVAADGAAANGAAAGTPEETQVKNSVGNPAPYADKTAESDAPVSDFARLKKIGAEKSRYLAPRFAPEVGVAPGANLTAFRDEIEPILTRSCLRCHGPDKSKAGVRVDELDPDLFAGEDVDWWLDVLSVLSNGEMPPPDATELSPEDRGKVIEWLSSEIETASSVRSGGSSGLSTVRRMTKYEYEYALQDLLGLPYRFADDLPPDPESTHGFQNSSDTLHLAPSQLRTYFDSNRKALESATFDGEKPSTLYWDIPMEAAALFEWKLQDQKVAEARKKHAKDPGALEKQLAKLREQFSKRPRNAHYESMATGRLGKQSWRYHGAKYVWTPTDVEPDGSALARPESIDLVGVIPRGRGMILELGEKLPEDGMLRVRVLASRASETEAAAPSLRLAFGWQASNDSRAVVEVSQEDLAIEAPAGAPEVYEFEVPMHDIEPRNWVRKTATLGGLPSPSEYVKLMNASVTGGPIRVHHVEVAAPVFASWPPASHTRLYPSSSPEGDLPDETAYATELLADFMPRAWRRPPSPGELARKVRLFERLRPDAPNFETAMTEVMATVLTSPHFLFVGLDSGGHSEGELETAPVESGDPVGAKATEADGAAEAAGVELATRLSLFLWCSTPDAELLALAENGELNRDEVLRQQIERMLADPKAERFSHHFVRQWLGLSLLDFLEVDKKLHPKFNAQIKEAMAEEPVAFFQEILNGNLSVLEFLHADFAVVDERLARYYGMEDVKGNEFRRVETARDPERGGLLTQAGLLAMNSDGKDSHPLKRGVWLLERLLDDPPPPPPPAVPEIDLADPRIAQMTLKERIEDHRNHAACMSCHAKIDPWGFAFENYDAAGLWRTEVKDKPIDASSVLFNGQELDGMAGLKAFLLENRQDQFVRALVHKMTAFAMGRPLSFEDRAAVDAITAELRKSGDGLATMVELIATSELFRSK